jgi:hypothetical protein
MLPTNTTECRHKQSGRNWPVKPVIRPERRGARGKTLP